MAGTDAVWGGPSLQGGAHGCRDSLGSQRDERLKVSAPAPSAGGRRVTDTYCLEAGGQRTWMVKRVSCPEAPKRPLIGPRSPCGMSPFVTETMIGAMLICEILTRMSFRPQNTLPPAVRRWAIQTEKRIWSFIYSFLR